MSKNRLPYFIEEVYNRKRLTVEDFRKWLADLKRIGVIDPFTADGESFFFIRNFADHQRVDRPSKMRNPPCPRDILAGPSRVFHEPLATDSRECSDETETETETETEIQTTTAAADEDRPPLKEGERGIWPILLLQTPILRILYLSYLQL